MSRLSLVVADLDRDYLSKLEKFLMVNYPQRFDIYSFSSHGKLTEFLNCPQRRDLLLINGILFKRELNLANIETVVLLKGDGPDAIPEGMAAVNKYQHAERLVTDLLRLYSAKSRKSAAVNGHNATRTVCVHSPAGGTGKSSIAAGCSVLCAGRGLKTFYLNMEEIPSTNLFFQGESSQSLSNVIYHLKGKDGSMGLKLEGAKCCDSETGVYFFAPPESVLEMEELTAEDVSRLVSGLKESGLYDIIFIDMPAGLSRRNTAILKDSDVVLLILANRNGSALKTGIFQKGLQMLEQKCEAGLMEKIIPVLNLCGKNDMADHGVPISDRPVATIDEFPHKSGKSGCQGELVRDKAFLSVLSKLLEYVLPPDSVEIHACFGGGCIG